MKKTLPLRVTIRLSLAIALDAARLDHAESRRRPQSRPGLFVCLPVSDTGCGMAEATLRRVLEPFFTTKEAGTGLGLATVQGIVGQHKGWVEVESSPGAGTSFRIILPATSRAIAPPSDSNSTPSTPGHETVLLVKDEPSVRRAASRSLRALGYSVLEAANGREARKVWKDRTCRIDLLLSDMVMPEGLTGLDLARQLRERDPSLKVIICTGYSAEMVGGNLAAMEGIGRLQKPYAMEQLSGALRRVLEQRGEA